jgi:hypothetical protein
MPEPAPARVPDDAARDPARGGAPAPRLPTPSAALLAAVRRSAPGPWAAEPIKHGTASKANLYRVRHAGGLSVVVKDYAGKPWPFRLLGRWFLANEDAVYRQLRGIPGIPICYGRPDADALVLQDVPGVQIHLWPNIEADGAHLFERLSATAAAMHAAGVAHLDLRCRGNVLVTRQRDVYIIDFASAVSFRPGGAGHALFFPVLEWLDGTAVVKLKKRMGLPLSDAEQMISAGAGFFSRLRHGLRVRRPKSAADREIQRKGARGWLGENEAPPR